ncbi:CheR family methyltransferase [Okeania sp. SIO2B3]|uniref:CheR family methyltransferase n=1 Tax=Okeania sp. SIO2B3 TaxID=2607784 RepID=UPI0013C0FCF1|nr:CheR family methyltransferase [Okeania sp. SIO2B3]NET41884.1 response regulator [Okeania sp. SIO2B3]
MKLQLENQLFVVGIAIFAENIQLLETFFSHLPKQLNIAFIIVVQNQSTNFPSQLVQLLEGKTSLTVHTIEDGMKMNPWTIYIVPEGKYLQLETQTLNLLDLLLKSDTPINYFFKSLAQEWGKHALAILIPGSSSDGQEGLAAIRDANGVALVKSPETDQFTSMSTNAISPELIEEILSPVELAQLIYHIVEWEENPLFSRDDRESPLIPSEELQEILSILYKYKEVDFSYYKTSTITRRIIHRCTLVRSGKLENYIHYLKNSEEEQKILYQDLLIGATSFFRDPPAWEYLRTEILPELVKKVQQEEKQLRIWVCACATGEEAYSMAILLNEAIRETGKSLNVKIFATDIDTNALETAARGIYPESIAKYISQEYLERYFHHEVGSYQVKRSLREMLIFAPHDLTKNPGFSRMNLVSCRNVLIYMQPELQQRVLRLLHFSLSSQGILFLGNTESVRELEEEFIVLKSCFKVYRKRRDVQLSLTHLAPKAVTMPTIYYSIQTKLNRSRLDKMLTEVFQVGFGERKITALLVNVDNRLLNVFYNEADLLQIPIGEANLEITDIILPELKLPLDTALHRAKRDKLTVLYTGIKFYRNDREENITLRVGYNCNAPSLEEYLIVFLEIETPPTVSLLNDRQKKVYEVAPEVAQQITELEYELQQTRENLQAAVEELETINEEQQATNEELLASNEELQSTNEELQSTNEELFTINSQYQAKIEELTHLSEDIDNLLRSIDIGVVFLDKNLKIRKFTPPATQAINIRGTDINRPIYHFTHNLDCPDFIAIIQQALSNQKLIEREVTLSATGENLLLRIHPYIREDDINDGIVITLVNINELQKTKTLLTRTNNVLESLYESSPAGLFLLDQELRFLRINPIFAEINNLNVSENIGKIFSEVLPYLADQLNPLFHEILETGEIIRNIEINAPHPTNIETVGWWLSSYYPVELENGKQGIGGVITEITQLKQTQQQLLESQKLAEAANKTKSDFFKQMTHELRTPLNVILGFTQLLAHGDNLDRQQREQLDLIYKSGNNLLELVEEVLDFSKLEANRMELKLSLFDFKAFITELREMFRPSAEKKGFNLLLELDERVPQYIYGDRQKLRQVLINFLSNAIKFTDVGHVKLSVRVAQISEINDTEVNPVDLTNNLEFEIEDTGKGITQQELEKIFEAFVQGKAGRYSQTGTGLGLSISQGFVQLMGGDIHVQSCLGSGTTFSFSIIVNYAADTTHTKLPIVQQILGLAPEQPEYRILVVDDIEENRKLLLMMLRPLGFRILEAANGEEALHQWEQHQPQLICMDLRMPGMNGFEAIEQIKSTPEGQNTMIIALSASGAFSDEQHSFLEDNCCHILSKPVEEDVLLNSIAECIGVKYIYSSCHITPAPDTDASAVSNLSKDILSDMSLSSEFRSQLQMAALSCSSEEVISLLEQIPDEHQQLTDALMELADEFRFDLIAELMEEE